jgi:hypothetical protein
MTITKTNARGVHVISTLEEWYTYAPPKSPSHWRAGRSAMEIARAWLGNGDGSLPEEVAAIVSSHPEFGAVVSWSAEPEARLHFDSFAGEPRNSDLLVLAEDNFGPYLIAVEGKADEPYGETVGKAAVNAAKRLLENPRSNGMARLEQLATALLPPGIPSEILNALRYQLLTACAGAVAEANRRGLARAVMLVHEFITTETEDMRHQSNARDLDAFLTQMSPGEAAVSLQEGHLLGPFGHSGYPEVRLYVGKVSRMMRNAPVQPQ